MKLLRIAVLLCVIPAVIPVSAFGQRGGGSRGGGGGARSGGGGFRGGGGSFGGGFARGGGSVGAGFARGGNVVTRGGGVGFRGNTVFRGGNRFIGNSRFFGGRYYGSYYYPYLGFGYGFGYGGYPYSYYPYSYDPYYYDPYAYGAAYGPSYYNGGGYYDNNVGYAQPSQPAPPTVINQNIGAPTTGGQAGSFYRAADYYLIAFTDHTIRAAVSYTVEGDQIRYTTREHEERTAPLSSVDVRFSEQINRDRRVEFRLP
jgi:hypothetical protein